MKLLSCLKWQFSWWFIDLAKYVARCVKTSLLKLGEGERTLNHFKLLLKFLSAMTYLNDSHQIWDICKDGKIILPSFDSVTLSFNWIQRLHLRSPLQQRQHLFVESFFMTFFFPLLNFVWFHFPLLTSNLVGFSNVSGWICYINSNEKKNGFSGLNWIQCCCCCCCCAGSREFYI